MCKNPATCNVFRVFSEFLVLQVFSEFNIKYVLNVTPTCPNCFEEEKDITYMRIAVTDTGSQKLSDRFKEAFEFIGWWT